MFADIPYFIFLVKSIFADIILFFPSIYLCIDDLALHVGEFYCSYFFVYLTTYNTLHIKILCLTVYDRGGRLGDKIWQ